MEREQLLLAESIRQTLKDAEASKHKYGEYMENESSEPVDDYGETPRETFIFYVQRAFQDTAVLAERMGLPLLTQQIHQNWPSDDEIADLRPVEWDVELNSKALSMLRRFFSPLETMLHAGAATRLDVFRNILENTAKIIADASLEPTNETQVRNEILRILQYAFPDAKKEIELPKNFRRYRADVGVPSLMAVAEYKYADSKEKVKVALDAIYTDMKAYGNDDSWRTFYAVIYMNQPFFTQREFDDEFRLVRADRNWTPIAVVGPSGAKPTRASKKPVSGKATSDKRDARSAEALGVFARPTSAVSI